MNVWLNVVMLVLLPSVAMAGEIRGAVTMGGRSIGQGVPIEVRCGEKVYPATTDKYGLYRLFVPDMGKCQFQLTYQNQTPSREVISFEDSTRYDLALEKEGDHYVLRRK
jgi:hypothetical protein